MKNTRTSFARFAQVSASLLVATFALGLGVVGCAAETADGEELWDEGPLAEDAQAAAESVDPSEVGEVSEALSSASFQLPFPCNQVWSGQTRTNHSPQNSVDFNRANDEGDDVVAAAAGTVSVVQNLGNRSYGRWIEVRHADGYTTRYAHLQAQSVSVGQRVAQGQKLGLLGTTGGSTGPHLHFEVRRNGVTVRASFAGSPALYFGTRNYTSKNCKASAGGSPAGGSPAGGSSGFAARVDTAGADLKVRAGAGTSHAVVGTVGDGASVTIACQKRGTTVRGTFGTTDLWDKIGSGYVSDAFVYTGRDGRVAPDCP